MISDDKKREEEKLNNNTRDSNSTSEGDSQLSSNGTFSPSLEESGVSPKTQNVTITQEFQEIEELEKSSYIPDYTVEEDDKDIELSITDISNAGKVTMTANQKIQVPSFG